MDNPATILPVIAPEFAGVDAANAIAIAEMQVADGLCGDRRPLLVAYLTAHILTMGNRQGSAGGVTSLKEGNLSITYGANAGGDNLQSTSYGAEYHRLKRACTFAARTRVNG